MIQKLLLRLPIELKDWLRFQAELNASSLNSEIVRCIRMRKDGDPMASEMTAIN